MRSSHRGDFLSVAGRREPVVDGCADTAARDGRLACPGVASDQQDDPLLVNDRLLERPVNRLPGAVEIVAVEVDDTVWLDIAGAKLSVPA